MIFHLGVSMYTHLRGKVSAYDFFKQGLDYFAYNEEFTSAYNKVPDAVRTINDERKVGGDAFQMIRYHGMSQQCKFLYLKPMLYHLKNQYIFQQKQNGKKML